MPFLGIFNVKSKISGSWEPSPTARPWAEMKECRGAAGRWDRNKKPFLWAQWDELGKGSRKKGEPHFTVRGSTKKALFRLFIERAISLLSSHSPVLSTIQWEAPFFSSLLSQDAESIPVSFLRRGFSHTPEASSGGPQHFTAGCMLLLPTQLWKRLYALSPLPPPPRTPSSPSAYPSPSSTSYSSSIPKTRNSKVWKDNAPKWGLLFGRG